ncbi:uncharacterized protein LOC143018679 [Oratosquilla oratoria]|uniref:uncharacterized protein LOC143018679 n=1 Tax=Oratosquilla oratoria TaxID=337810 RepID=UPI003F75B5FE
MAPLSITNFARARLCFALLLKSFFKCSSGTQEEDLAHQGVLRGEVETPSNLRQRESPSTSETIEVASRRPFRANYHIHFSLGSGGFGETFVVSDSATGSTGVSKIPLRGKACANETSKEIEALKALVHCLRGTLSTISKRTLSGQASSSSSLAWSARVVSYAMQLVAAVTFMHENGFVHLDLKADKVVLDDKEEVVKVTDFGTSAKTSNAYKQEMTTVQGMPWYMSPEVLGKMQNPYAGDKADVWYL